MKTPRRAASAALTLHECKIRASVLLKELRGDERPPALRAAERFRALPRFAELDPDTILERRESIQLKHALAAIAAELGYTTWTACKQRLEIPATLRLDTERFFESRTGERIGAAFLNRWFARYSEARSSLEAEGGYLFPFRHQFFICEYGFLQAREIDLSDPDWERIGRDWVRPADVEARDRLEHRLIAMGYGGRDPN